MHLTSPSPPGNAGTDSKLGVCVEPETHNSQFGGRKGKTAKVSG